MKIAIISQRFQQSSAVAKCLLYDRVNRVPLDWAMAQTRLGGALQTLGAREQ